MNMLAEQNNGSSNDHQDDHQNDGRIAGRRFSQEHPKLYGSEEEQANIAFLKKKKKKKQNYHLWCQYLICLSLVKF